MTTRLATRSNLRLPPSLIAEIERHRPGLARHMARAVVSLVHWDSSTGAPPEREAIPSACAAGLDLFLATAREARPATRPGLRQAAPRGILPPRGSQSVQLILASYRTGAPAGL